MNIVGSYDELRGISWNAIPGQFYQVEVKTNLLSDEWHLEDYGWPWSAGSYEAFLWYSGPVLPMRYFRVKQVPSE
jgi:hypothetical protein